MAATEFDASKYCDDKFTDVPGSVLYAPYVNYAFASGIVSGYENAIFKPYDNLTRAGAAKIVSITLQKGYKLKVAN